MNLKKGEINLLLLGGIAVASSLITYHGAQDFFGPGAGQFVKELITHPTEVGAFTPCSKYTAQTIVEPIKKSTQKRLRILEIGPGTGVITHQIVGAMAPDATLDLVEINPTFCQLLREQFTDQQNVTLYQMSILDFVPETQYDVVISALPLNAFEHSFVEQVLSKFKSLVKPGGSFSYVELRGIMPIKKVFSSEKSASLLEAKLNTINAFKTEYLEESITVMRNLPPIYVHRLKM